MQKKYLYVTALFAMAAKHLKEAVRLDPANKETRFNLELLLKKIK